MEKKIIRINMDRGFTIHEIETEEGKDFDLHIGEDLTPNQVMCMCAWALINVLRDTNCDEGEYIYVADKVKQMILDNDDHFIKYCYRKACEENETYEENKQRQTKRNF